MKTKLQNDFAISPAQSTKVFVPHPLHGLLDPPFASNKTINASMVEMHKKPAFDEREDIIVHTEKKRKLDILLHQIGFTQVPDEQVTDVLDPNVANLFMRGSLY